MASDAETLAAIFGGTAGSSRGPADLDQFEKTIAANDLFSKAAAPILGAKFDTRTWDTGTTLGVTAGQAFLGSLLQQYGQRDQAVQLEKAAQVLPQLYADPNSVATPDGVDSSAFNALRLSALKDSVGRTIADNNKTTSFKQELFKDLFTRRPDIAMKALGFANPDDAPKVAAMPVEDASGLASGKDSSAKKVQKYFQDFVANGMPATQAATAARQQVEGEIKANAKTFDEAKAAREYGQKLLDLTSTARAGMSQAGETGSFQGIRHAADLIGQLFSQESADKITGDAVLNSIAPSLVQMSRSPGAVSDFETKLYLGSGPSVHNTPETNAILTKKMEDLGKLHLDYADFLDAYREANAGSTIGASKKWSEYRQSYPLFKGEGEKIELNSDRPSWQEYFSGEAPAPSKGADTTALPSVGGTFQGKKVLSVKKIK